MGTNEFLLCVQNLIHYCHTNNQNVWTQESFIYFFMATAAPRGDVNDSVISVVESTHRPYLRLDN